MQRSMIASYCLVAALILLVLYHHLIAAVLAGLAVHVLTVKLAGKLPPHWSRWAREVALGLIAFVVVLFLLGAGFGLWIFFRANDLSSLLTSAAETLDNMRRTLPASMVEYIPTSIDQLRQQAAQLLREHGRNLSRVGIEGMRFFVHLLIGMVIGGMTSLHHFQREQHAAPLAEALHNRLSTLTDAFEKVVFAQVTISLINTSLTAIYLLLILPFFGAHLPLRPVLLALTFICGLLPVVGNILSNLVILLISLGQSVNVGIASLVFLLAVHKLEYFLNARIVGGKVHAHAWEILPAMLLMEAIFGLPGLIVAPIIYAWAKFELEGARLA